MAAIGTSSISPFNSIEAISRRNSHAIGCPDPIDGLPPDLFHRVVGEGKKLSFIRDWGVRRLDGSFVTPYCFRSSPDDRFKAMLPEGGGRFGMGFFQTNQQRARDLFPGAIQGRCAIEGGNCFLFTNSEGKPTALIGRNSLVLTLIGLEEQGGFIPRKDFPDGVPSEEAFRMARNLSLYQPRAEYEEKIARLREEISQAKDPIQAVPLRVKLAALLAEKRQKLGPDKTYEEALMTPVKEEEKESLTLRARELEARLREAKGAISEELQIPLSQIAFLEQERYHIDLEVCVVKGIVFLNSERLVQEAVGDPGRDRDLQRALNLSRARQERNRECLERNKKAIEEVGCRMIQIAGIFEGCTTIMNAMNGVVLNETFFTNGSTRVFSLFEPPFRDAVKRAVPDVEVSFSGKGVLSVIFQENGGGLRCLTQALYTASD